MRDELKKAVLVFGGGFLLFWLLKDWNMGKKGKGGDKGQKMKTPEIDPKDIKNKQQANAFIGLKAYIDAINHGENDKALEELNRELAKDLKVRVYKRSSDGKLVASDLKGNILIVNKG